MPWLTPKTDWIKDDYYNFEDLDRVENNTEIVASLISQFAESPVLIVETGRTMQTIDLADSLNRIEGNIDLLKAHYQPTAWQAVKTTWQANDSFNYLDAIRLEKNLDLLHFYYQGNINAFRYCGAYTCGEEVV